MSDGAVPISSGMVSSGNTTKPYIMLIICVCVYIYIYVHAHILSITLLTGPYISAHNSKCVGLLLLQGP